MPKRTDERQCRYCLQPKIQRDERPRALEPPDRRIAVGSDDFVGADTSIGRHISAGIRNANVGRDVTHRMVRTLNRCGDQPGRKFLTRTMNGLRHRMPGTVSQKRESHDRPQIRCDGFHPVIVTASRHKFAQPTSADGAAQRSASRS